MKKVTEIIIIMFRNAVASLILALFLLSPVRSSDFVLKTLETELQGNFQKLKKGDNPPYFLSYYVIDSEETNVSAGYGAIENSSQNRSRRLDIEIRVGDYSLDSSHRMRGRRGLSSSDRWIEGATVPVEDDPSAFKNILWNQTDLAYKNSLEKLIKITSQQKVKVDEEDPSPDFSTAPQQTSSLDIATLPFDRKDWEEKLRKWSALFKPYPEIYDSGLRMSLVKTIRTLVNSEGTKVQSGRNHVRLSIQVMTQAEDGMELSLSEHFDGSTLEQIPDEKIVTQTIKTLADTLVALRSAPIAEPYAGPAILSGRASAVFFHEILGHRLEGHRQKDEKEGQTFTKKLGTAILPEFISVYDDPTAENVGTTELNGHYLYDDEGVKADKTMLVEKGILKNFLMSRSPIKGFSKSNGHGRKQSRNRVVARQGNLIVESERTVSDEELRNRLKVEIKNKNKPYGLFFKEIEGGFTTTGRFMPNAFNVRPVLVYKVFTDDKPDRLVRGVDLIGTPLTPLSKILVTGKKKGIFNGYCGAESGFIPVSGVSPDILIEEVEVQKKEKSEERVPILKPPLYDSPANR